MSVSSLPSPYGIGTLGQKAYEFVDFLKSANQKYWQVLPLGQTGYGDSPYQSVSTYAGNPYFVDLDILIEEGLLLKEEVESVQWVFEEDRIDYGNMYYYRFDILKKAFERGFTKEEAEISRFKEENPWLENYTLYMALKKKFDMKMWQEWDIEYRNREPLAIEKAKEELREDMDFYAFIQYHFFKQWHKLKAYANEKGIGIIGDIPIYISMDSADIWAEPSYFQLDKENIPLGVAGVPPDYFTADGQLWGNPLYDWEKMREDGYAWWIRRIAGVKKLYDVLRIDHFRGLESYWVVPYGDTTAKNGHWEKGPGMDLMSVLQNNFRDLEFIAEDLGYLTPEVKDLLRDSALPGMKVLEFAFDSREPSDYLPHTYPRNCVCYIGTHDNTPVVAWREEAAKEDVAMAIRYLGLNEEEGFHWGMIRAGITSVANLFITQVQDYLGLGARSRMNTPGIASGNWQWRLTEEDFRKLREEYREKIAYMTWMSGR